MIAMSASIPPRRSPVQERSQETVQRVLTATAAMLGRGISIESLTTAHLRMDPSWDPIRNDARFQKLANANP